MPRRCFAELVSATSHTGTVTADVEITLSKSLVVVEIDFSSFWPPRMASLEGFWACVAARWRVWRPVDPSAGGGPAQRTRADDHAAPERAEGRIWAARALFPAAFGMRAMRKKLRCYRCGVRACSGPTWWLGRV